MELCLFTLVFQSQSKKNKKETGSAVLRIRCSRLPFDFYLILLTQNGCVSSCNFCITGFNGENVSRLLTNLIIFPFARKCRKITSSTTIMVKLKLCGIGKLVNSCVNIFTIIFYQPALFHFLVQPANQGFQGVLVRQRPYTCSSLEHLALA